MKRVLMLYPEMLFYKIPIFNKLELFLKEQGYELIIWATSYEDKNNLKKFSHIEDTPLNIKNYLKVLKEHKIDFVINILFKSKPGYIFYMSCILLTRLKGIPIIFYGHGINKQLDTPLSNFIYNLFYFLFNGIILYSPIEKEKLWRIFHHKITIAYNTLDMEGKRDYVNETKDVIKEKYGISQQKVVLTTGRLHPRKKIDQLLEFFKSQKESLSDTAWVIVGPDLSDTILNDIKDEENIYYLGPIYEPVQMSEIFYMSDIYSIPGFLGLGIVEAVYWGLPIVTQKGKHAPELFFLENNVNGFISDSKEDFNSKLMQLLNDNALRKKFSENAINKFNNFGTLEKMFSGFNQQLKRFVKKSIYNL